MGKLLGDLEQKIMNIIWDAQGPVKPADIQHLLGDKLAYTTIVTILKRLMDKGLLSRRKTDGIFHYQATQPKEDFAERNLADVFGGILNSYGELAISQFIDTVKRDPENLKALREYLHEDK